MARLAVECHVPAVAGCGWGSQRLPLHVQREHLGRDGAVPRVVAAHAAALRFIIGTVVHELLCGGDERRCHRDLATPLAKVKLTYFTTMRADVSVAHRGSDGCVYFNVMVLQQQGCIDAAALPAAATGASTGEPEPGWQNWRQWMQPPRELDLQVSPAVMQRRTWRYWLERAAAALGHRAPAGLYDAQVRARFKAFMGDSARANQ